MNIAGSSAAAQSIPHRGGSHATHGREYPACLGIDRLVENLCAVLLSAGAGKVEAAIPDRPMRIVVDEEGMDEAFATFGNAVARGAAVTILGDLVRIETGETDRDKGCALLAISVTGGQAVAKTGVRDALSAMRGIIKKQRGFLRFWEGRGEMRLSLYLPVLHNP
jgi:hypothetical protein